MEGREHCQMRKSTALAGAAVLVTAGLTASPAMADPSKGLVLEVDCGEGPMILATNSGKGTYTPAFDPDSNKVYVPVSFGEVSFAVYDGDGGGLLYEGTEPAVPRGGKRTGQGAMECAWTSSLSEDTPDGPIDVYVSGTVYIKIKAA